MGRRRPHAPSEAPIPNNRSCFLSSSASFRCITGTAHRVGYARVSTLDQNPELQLDALKEAGCRKVFQEKVSWSKEARPQLLAALDYLRAGDTLVVWKLDRLARSMKQLIQAVDLLNLVASASGP